MANLARLLISGLVALGLAAPAGAEKTPEILRLTIAEPITPVTAMAVEALIERVNDPAGNYQAALIELDTPGGLDGSMRAIIKSIKSSARPVIVFVAPSGSRAASAGAFITIAAHIAAMTPGSSIGAASPVAVGAKMDETMKSKVTNDAVAYIKSLAVDRSRNPDLAALFVSEAKSISEREALEGKIIDLIATDATELLNAVDRRKIKTSAAEIELNTLNARIVDVETGWRHKALGLIANPNVAYLLMLIGFYGILLELYNPGAIFPAVVGSICLILALYAAQVLPINYSGALLIALAMILFTLEIWIPSYGGLTLGAIVAFLIGSLMLIDSPEKYLRISLWLIVQMTVITAGVFLFLIGSGARAQFASRKGGADQYIGRETSLTKTIDPDSGKLGSASLDGYSWNFSSAEKIEKGSTVIVTGREGLTILCERKKGNN